MRDKTVKELKEIAKNKGLEFPSKIKKDDLIKLIEGKPSQVKDGVRDYLIICLHCSDSDIHGHDDIKVIRKWHVDERGWSDVGYHYFIKKNGTVQKGREIGVMGAGAKGWNEDSIHICVSGRKLFTANSLKSLESLIKSLLDRYPSINQIIGHCELDDNKTCPNYSTKRFKLLLNG